LGQARLRLSTNPQGGRSPVEAVHAAALSRQARHLGMHRALTLASQLSEMGEVARIVVIVEEAGAAVDM